MSLSDSLFRCSTLGVDDCVIWWEAWAVVAAVIALVIAFAALCAAVYGAFATLVSGVAVAWLGSQANQLARAAEIRLAEEERRAAIAFDRNQRLEEQVLLVYMLDDFRRLHRTAMRISRYLKQRTVYSAASYIGSVEAREEVTEELEGLRIARAAEVFPRLHMLPSATGVRIARVLGMSQTLIAQSEQLAVPPSMPLNREFMEMFNKNLAANHGLIVSWISDIEINAKHLWNKALAAGSSENIEGINLGGRDDE